MGVGIRWGVSGGFLPLFLKVKAFRFDLGEQGMDGAPLLPSCLHFSFYSYSDVIKNLSHCSCTWKTHPPFLQASIKECWIGKKWNKHAFKCQIFWYIYQPWESRMTCWASRLHHNTKAKASGHGSIDGQRSDTFKQFRETKHIHSARRAIQSQLAVTWKEITVKVHCTGHSVMIMINIYVYRPETDRKSARDKDKYRLWYSMYAPSAFLTIHVETIIANMAFSIFVNL